MKAIICCALLAVCVSGQMLDQTMMTKVPLMVNTQKMMTYPFYMNTQMKMDNQMFNTMEQFNRNLLTIQEIVQHPLFQVYYQIPLFRQYFTYPVFQVYLTTPQFQNYWTYPMFPIFFKDSTLFFKYIYPQVFQTTMVPSNQFVTPSVFQQSTFVPTFNNQWWMNTNTVQSRNYPINFQYPTGIDNIFVQNDKYDDVIKRILFNVNMNQNIPMFQKNFQNYYFDRIFKDALFNKVSTLNPQEMTQYKTEVKIPTITNPIEKILNENKIVESPIEIVKDDLMKDTLMGKDTESMKDDLVKETLFNDPIKMKEDLIKKFYFDKMMDKSNMWAFNNMNKQSIPEQTVIFQKKLEQMIPNIGSHRVRRNAIYTSAIPTTGFNTVVPNFYKNVPLVNYNKNMATVPTVYYNVPTSTVPQMYYSPTVNSGFTTTYTSPFNNFYYPTTRTMV